MTAKRHQKHMINIALYHHIKSFMNRKKSSLLIKQRLVIYLSLAALLLTPFTFAYAIEDETYNYDFFSSNDVLYYDSRAQLCGFTSNNGETINVVNNTEVPSSFSLGTDNAMRPVNLARQLMIDFSLKDYQAAGIVGNFMLESGGKHVPPDINEGTSTPAPPRFIGGYGWAQWTGGRQVSFIDYAVNNGFMASKTVNATDAANYAYLKYELINTEKSTIPAVLGANTAAEAATEFEDKFERAGVPALTRRIEYAEQLYAALQNNTGIDAPTSTTPATLNAECIHQGSGLITPGVVFNDIVFPLSARKSDILNPEIFANNTTSQGGHPYISFDIYAKAGTSVLAFATGVVTQIVQPSPGSMGGSVTLYDESKNIHVYYTHLNPSSSVNIGDKIAAGVTIGSLVSVNDYPTINVDHLHIDAGEGSKRLACSRTNPNGAACDTRIDIGPDLYNAWMIIPD